MTPLSGGSSSWDNLQWPPWKSNAATGKATSCCGLPREHRRNGLCVDRESVETKNHCNGNGACDAANPPTKQGTRVNSLSLVRYRTNDYSVPVAYGHQEVWIRGYVHEVVIGCGAGIIARHPRSYDREDMVFDPIHYLPLLEHKIGALDQAAPLAGWELPDAFPTLRRLLEARMGKAGKRVPLHGFGVVLRDAFTVGVHDSEIELRKGMPLHRQDGVLSA